MILGEIKGLIVNGKKTMIMKMAVVVAVVVAIRKIKKTTMLIAAYHP